ncbi:MAG TPA: hypothetical protein VK095_04200 [Beutenbergiaceae bacterium]|nr:hypothetical protein [Beutenbergiaceae bacterium]
MSNTGTLPPPGEFKTTQEIRDAKYADELRRRRRRLLWWSLPVVLLAFLVALKLISAVVINAAGTSAYDNQNHNTAASRFEALEFVNVVEPWKPYFNSGTAIYASGDFFAATVPLTTALDLVPKDPPEAPRGEEECAVRTNYSLALEGLGDEAMIAEQPDMALDYYDQAQEMLDDCGEDGGSGGEEAQEAEERQQESHGEAEEQQQQQDQEQEQGPSDEEGEDYQDESDGDPDQGEDTGDSEDGEEEQDQGNEEDSQGGGQEDDEPIDDQQRELEERNQDAEQSRQADEERDGGGDGSGQNW